MIYKKTRIFAGILLTIMHVFCAGNQAAIPAAVYEDIITEIFPREEGSSNEKKIIGFIEARLTAAGIAFTRYPFNNSLTSHSFSSAIIVNIPGKKEDTLILTIPVNHPPEAEAETSGSVNIALGLALCEHFQHRELPISIQINFMGAEYGDRATYPLGTQLYLEDFFPAYPVMHLYLKFENIPKRIYIQGGSPNIISPYWMITRATTALHESGLSFLVKGNENQLYRFGLASDSYHLAPTLERDIPSLSFTGNSQETTTGINEDWYLKATIFFDHFLEQFTAGIPQEWDRHYLLFQARSFFLIINEKMYLIIITAVLSLSLIYILVFTRMFKGILKIFFRHFWQLLVIFVLIFMFTYLSSLSLKALSAYRGIPRLWQSAPFLFLLLKILEIFFFFILCRKFFSFQRFTNNRIFYSSGSLIILMLNTFAIAVINISFTYYFTWAFLFFLLAVIARHRLVKYLLFLPSAYWIIKTTIELFLIPQPDFCSSLLLSSIPLSLFISLLLLPFVLQSIAIFKKWRLRLGKYLHNMLLIIMGLLICGFHIYLLLFAPFSDENPQQVAVRQVLDLNKGSNTLELESNSRLGQVNIWVGDEYYFIDSPVTKYNIQLDSPPELLSLEKNQRAFLDRKNINLMLLTRTPPQKVYATLSADREFTLFDSNFPFIRQKKGMKYEILMGMNPPRPLPLELTLPEGHSYTLSLCLEYNRFPFRFELTGQAKSFTSRLILYKDIVIDT